MKNDFSPKKIFSLFNGDWHDIGVIVIYALGVGICSLALPVAVQSLVNTVSFGTLMQPIVVLTAVVGGVLLFSGVMRILQLCAVETIQRRLVVRVGLMLAQRVPHVKLESFIRDFGSDYVLRFMEVFKVQKIAAALLLDGISIFFQIVIGLALVAFYHPVFLAFALVLCIAVSFVIFGLGIGGVRTSIAESNSKYDFVEWLQDLATTPTVFKF